MAAGLSAGKKRAQSRKSKAGGARQIQALRVMMGDVMESAGQARKLELPQACA